MGVALHPIVQSPTDRATEWALLHVWFQVVLVWFASTSKTRSQVDPSAAPLYLARNVLEHSQIQPVFDITSCFVPNCFQVSDHVPNSFSNFSN